jgi:hypothetical protein
MWSRNIPDLKEKDDMNNSKLALIALLGGALMAFGCDDGDGVTGGTGGGGPGGTGGAIDPLCQTPPPVRCESGITQAIEDCCPDLDTPPVQPNACTGDESTDNPAGCMANGTKVTHKLTLLALDNDCNAGFDLDDCDGYTCVAGSINDASEGLMGHDNGLASIALNVEELAMINLTGVQQALNDSLCGLTDDPATGTCSVAVGTACTSDAECPMGETCNLDDDDCGADIPPLELFFDVEANAAAGCANVIVRSVGLCSDSGTCSATVATTCAFDSDCPATETCTGAMTCEADATCDPGTCLGGGTSEPQVLNLTAPTNGACEDTGTCTDTGTCSAAPNGPCTSAADCPDPTTETCDNATACTSNDGCDVDVVCDGATACAAGADCDVQGACTGTGTCSGDAAGPCTSAADCPDPTTETCDGATACTSNDGCAADVVCVGGVEGVSCLGATVCASGELGTIPVTLAGTAGVLGNAVVRMTVSDAGFSDGLLGATADSETAIAIASAISDVAAGVVDLTFDINSTVTQDTSAMCDALSMTLEVGGNAEAAP